MLSGRTVLITGGATGIGLETGRQLAARGNRVVICGRRAPLVEAAVRSTPGLRGIACDIGREEGLRALLEYLHAERLQVDFLVNNAGVQVQTDFAADADEVLQAIEEELRINLLAPIKLTKRLLPGLLASGHGVVVNMVSLLAVMPKGNAPGYCASKGGLVAFSKSLRVLLGDRVRICIAYPPLVDTPMTHGRGSNKMPVDVFVREMLEQLAAARLDIRVGQAAMLLTLDRVAPGLAAWWTQRISTGRTLPIR
jgi:short-subunit dehydrogenase involved in D-alanine esterification of teichoic acids